VQVLAAEQVRPVPQAMVPAQQGCALPPQVLQAPAEQTVPAAVQALPAQQGPLTAPHATHEPLEQIEPLVQTFPQQGWPTFPHAPQVAVGPQTAPALHVVPQQG
jgi:hypothetical protein